VYLTHTRGTEKGESLPLLWPVGERGGAATGSFKILTGLVVEILKTAELFTARSGAFV
jgi:hypothetical protein